MSCKPTYKGVRYNSLDELYKVNGINQQQKQQAQQLYSQYLNTIFPNSKVKDIVYHGTTATFEKFMKMYNNIHFGTLKAAKERLATIKNQRKSSNENIYPVILDIKRPIITDADFDWELDSAGEQPDPYELIRTVGYLDNWLYQNGYLPKEESDIFGLPDKSIPERVALWKNHDSYIYKNFVEDKGSKSYSIFEPEQIHILGNKQDIEGFKEFVNNKQLVKQGVEELFESNPELANSVYEALGFNPIQSIINNSENTLDLSNKLKSLTKNDFLKNSFEKLIPYIEKNSNIEFTALRTIGVGEALYTGEFTVLPNEHRDLQDFIKTYIHELYHVITLNELSNNKKFNLSITKLREESIEKLGLDKEKFKNLKNTDFGLSAPSLYYGLLNNQEFISELFSNKQFSDKLDTIKIEKNKSLLDKGFDLINRLFNKTSTSDKLRNFILNNIKEKILFDRSDVNMEVSKNMQEAAKSSDYVFTPNTQQKQEAQQLYSQYLDTIFPDSQVKDIVYHGSGQQFEKFLKEKLSQSPVIHFSKKKDGTGWYKFNYPVLLNIKKLYDYGWLDRKDKDTNLPAIEGAVLDNFNESDLKRLTNQGYDGAFGYGQITYEKGVPTDNLEYVVFEPEQIHILGSQQDIKGFKEFVNNLEMSAKSPNFAYSADAEIFESNIQTLKDTFDMDNKFFINLGISDTSYFDTITPDEAKELIMKYCNQ